MAPRSASFFAGKARRVARIDHLFGRAGAVGEDILFAAHAGSTLGHREIDRAAGNPAAFERAPLGGPLGQPAIEDRHLSEAVQPEDVPRAGRAADRAVVIQHDPVRRCHPELPQPRRELFGAWQGLGYRRTGIDEADKVEKPRAGHMRRREILRRLARTVRVGMTDPVGAICADLYPPAQNQGATGAK